MSTNSAEVSNNLKEQLQWLSSKSSSELLSSLFPSGVTNNPHKENENRPSFHPPMSIERAGTLMNTGWKSSYEKPRLPGERIQLPKGTIPVDVLSQIYEREAAKEEERRRYENQHQNRAGRRDQSNSNFVAGTAENRFQEPNEGDNPENAKRKTRVLHPTAIDYDNNETFDGYGADSNISSNVVQATTDNRMWTVSFPWDEEVTRINRKVFGNKEFRENQREAINAVLSKRDVFVMMPTGGGKSLIFQLAGLVSRGVTVVVMPLVSLMMDQYDQMEILGIGSKYFSASLSWEEQQEVYEELRKEETSIHMLFVTPEKINGSQAFQSLLKDLDSRDKLDRFAIDEAHCVSQWGNDFRKDYLQLNQLRKGFPKVPILALTATATLEVLADVQKQLYMKDAVIFRKSFDRPNLRYIILPKKKSTIIQTLAKLIQENFKNQAGIVYCLSKKETEETAEGLNAAGVTSSHYHASVNNTEREAIQRSWMNDEIRVIVATIAFGMGINKRDVRFVMHLTMPKSVENFYQESGRAGRDGEESTCFLFYDYGDKNRHQRLLELDRQMAKKQKAKNQANVLAMVRYCEDASTCRRRLLLDHFNDKTPVECSVPCDNCQRKKSGITQQMVRVADVIPKVVDLVKHATLLSRQGKHSRLTLVGLRDVLMGSKNKKLQWAEELRAFGALRGHKQLKTTDVPQLLKQMVLKEILTEVSHEISGSKTGPAFVWYVGLGRNAEDGQNVLTEIAITTAKKTSASKNDNLHHIAMKNVSSPGDANTGIVVQMVRAAGNRKRIPEKDKTVNYGAHENDSDESDDETIFVGSAPVAKRRKVADMTKKTFSARLQEELFQLLLAKRTELMRAMNIRNATNIASEACLKKMSVDAPTSISALKKIKGMTSLTKVQKFGSQFLSVIVKFLRSYSVEEPNTESPSCKKHPLAVSIFTNESDMTNDEEDDEFLNVGFDKNKHQRAMLPGDSSLKTIHLSGAAQEKIVGIDDLDDLDDMDL